MQGELAEVEEQVLAVGPHRAEVSPSSRSTRAARPRGFGALSRTGSPPSAASIRRAARRIVSPSAIAAALSPGERGPEALLGLGDAGAATSTSRQSAGSGRRSRWRRGRPGELGPARRGLGRQRRLRAARLLEEARIHEAEGAAAGAAPLDHLVAEARAPLPVLGDLGPGCPPPRRGGDRVEAGEARELGLDHRLSRRARSPPGSPRAAARRRRRPRR